MSRRTNLPARSLPLAIALALALAALPAAAATVVPVFVVGNPSCADLGHAGSSLKIDPPVDGTYGLLGDPANTVTVTITGGGVFLEWSSTIPIDRVIVKGGPGANVYAYDPESSGDAGLVSPVNASQGPAAISHIEFCFDYEVRVSKTAIPAYTRTYAWQIDKTAEPKALAMFRGDSGSVTYGVAVTRSEADSGHAVAGAITIENPSPFAAEIASVADVLSDGTTAAVACPDDLTIAPFGTMTCTYAAALADARTLTNTATVTTTGVVGGGTGTAPVVFGAPTTIVGSPSVHVADTNGMSWTAAGTAQWTYVRTFDCDRDAGGHDNIAAIVETGQADSEHVDVACWALAVSKTAETELDRTWSWTVAKTAAEPALTLSTGQQYVATYGVTVGATSADSGWAASGTISVTNPAPIPATLEGVTDLLPGSSVAVDCGVAFPYVLAPGATLACGWYGDLPDAGTRVNTATAVLANVPSGTTSFAGTAPVVFDGATTVHPFDACVSLDDSYEAAGLPAEVCIAGGASQSFTYTRPIGPYDVCGRTTVDNVVEIAGKDSGTTGSASAQIAVNVPCPTGCTLTPGYWKTHSSYGPAPYDETWALVGEDTPFFLSGQTYDQVLWTPPAGGNAYYVLAHAWIATKLNGLNEAAVPEEVAEAFAAAETILATYTPAEIAAMKGKAGTTLRAEILGYAYLLDQYNNGLAAGGPPHCSE